MIIKLGIIGFGGMGKWHAQNAPRAGVEIAAVCDIAEEKQKEAIEMGYRLYTNADELLADPEVNTVILTVPNYLHKEMCIKAAKAGKNVITEKPAAMSVQELDEMEAACKEAGVFFTSHQNRRWDKDMLTVKKHMMKDSLAIFLRLNPSCIPATDTCTNGICIKIRRRHDLRLGCASDRPDPVYDAGCQNQIRLCRHQKCTA